MTLASNEDDVTLLSQHGCGLDSFLTVNNREHLLHLLGVEACQHVVDDGLRLLKAGIVGGDDDAVALLHSLLGHERTLSLVAIAACSADGDDLSTLAVKHLVDGVEHILQGIGRMSIVDNGRYTVLRTDGFQTTCHALQGAEYDEDVLGLLA